MQTEQLVQLAQRLQLTPAAATALPAVVSKFAESSQLTESTMLRMCNGCKDLRDYAAELCYEVTTD
jgi:hypothetical protein